VGLSIYRALPPTNSLRIIDKQEKVRLERSPAIAKFQVACEPSTVPGEVALFATIENSPKGVDLSSEAFAQNSVVTVEIRGEQKK